MEAQTDLFGDDPPVQEHKTLNEQFQEYHQKNPLIFRLFERFARKALNAGLKQFGAKVIMERIRWEITISTQDDGKFKINNNFTSRYARLLVEKHPEFEGFFEFRELRAA